MGGFSAVTVLTYGKLEELFLGDLGCWFVWNELHSTHDSEGVAIFKEGGSDGFLDFISCFFGRFYFEAVIYDSGAFGKGDGVSC